MATLSESESRRLYSWWWDSHNSPKNSKWLLENLTDIDTKVKSMIKLIEEEADSFARRAEMYYKKRPELMKLVEEFYRAYRALAERYDHAMGELRHAHKTMPEAFPNSAYYILNDDSPCGSLGPDAESHTSARPTHRSKKNERSSEESNGEVQTLREALAKMQSDKDALFRQYQESLENLSKMETDLNKAQNNARGLDDRASEAEIQVEILKESLMQLKADKDAGEVLYNQCLETIARLESMLSQKDNIEAKNLKQELTRVVVQKDTVLLQYKQCLEKIPMLKNKIALAEENSRMLNDQIERTELEVETLRKNLAEMNEERDSLSVLYHHCLEKISKMENEILHVQENAEQLKNKIEKEAEKLEISEKHRGMLEKSNRNLQLEAENLVQRIASKDHELLEKHTEIERLQTLMHGEHSNFIQIESALQALQKLYSQSQKEQRNLALELKYGLLLLKDLELSKQDFKEEMQGIVEENKTLHELNFSSTRSLKKQQMEISKLKEIKEKLEREFHTSTEESNVLQRETHQIKDDIQHLNERYQAMLEQLQSLGLNPNSFAASVKDLQNENFMLKETCKKEHSEKEALREKSKDMNEVLMENACMEFSLLGLNDELDGLRGTVKEIQQFCHVLQEEKSILADEKSTLLSQLQIITESMQKILENNTVLEKSLSDAKIEFEGLRIKSGDLEDCCKLLNDEKNNLQNERSMLISQLEIVEEKLSNLEKKVTNLEVKYADVEKDKESAVNQVEELFASILVQKENHSNHKHSSEARLANLENIVRVLQEEQRLGKVEFEQELDRVVNAQIEMFILQNCIEELELKNFVLLTECEKLVEASKFSDKVISELESENLMQLIEEEFLLHRIRKFKMDIHKVCGVLQIDSDGGGDNEIKKEEIPISCILDKIESLESSLVKSQEENQQLLVENSVLLGSLQQHQSEGEKLKLEKKTVEQEFENMREQNVILQKDKVELLEENRQLRIEVVNGVEKENRSKSTLAALQAEMIELRQTNQVFQEENGKMLDEKNSLFRNVSDLKDAMSSAEDENSVMFHEVLALSNLNLVYEIFFTENMVEKRALCEHLGNLSHLNNDLNQELGVLRRNFEVKEAENVYLNESIERMDKELLEMDKRLKAAETSNAEFSRHIEELKMEQEESTKIKENLDRQILEQSENCMNHKKEIEHLNEANVTTLFVLFLGCHSKVTYDRKSLLINGQRRILISGSIHYPRSTPEMWEDLIRKAKHGGLDVIDTYVFWDVHEPSPGNYNFEGRYDLVRFIKTVQKAGLYANLRIGPYVCAEWNFGGIPVWLKYVPGISFRTDNGPFKAAMQGFTQKIVQMMKSEKLFQSQGGPIILSQIENEYGPESRATGAAGHAYLNWAANMAVGLGTGVPWVMCKENDAPDPVINSCNGFYCDDFSPNTPYKPSMWTESWSGWFTDFGGPIHQRPVQDLAFAVARFIQKGGSYVNYYMYHGGTNFGRSAGGPFISTSYDYDAPIDEYGLVRHPKYSHLKELHKAIKRCEHALVSSDPTVTPLGTLQQAHVFSAGTTGCAAFLANYHLKSAATVVFNSRHYDLPPWSISILPDCRTSVFNTANVGTQTSVVKMRPVDSRFSWETYDEDLSSLDESSRITAAGLLEHLNVTRDTSDYLWYITSVDISSSESFLRGGHKPNINVQSAGHAVHVFVNEQFLGSAFGTRKQRSCTFNGLVNLHAGANKIALLSVTVGLPNVGRHYETWETGITGPVVLHGLDHGPKDLSHNKWSYQVGLKGEAVNLVSPNGVSDNDWVQDSPATPSRSELKWYKAYFNTPEGNEPLALDLGSMGKGQVWINGQSIGRFWMAYAKGDCNSCNYSGTFRPAKCQLGCGQPTQRWYHVPRSWLKPTKNLIVVFEELGGNPWKISLVKRTVHTAAAR